MFEKGGSRGWVTVDLIEWHIGRKDSGYVLYIPPGQEFESSVPWYATWIINPDDPRFLLAACIHDTMLEDGFRPFMAAGEWYDAAVKYKTQPTITLVAAVFIAIRGVIRGKVSAKM